MRGSSYWVNVIQVLILGLLTGALLEQSRWLPRFGGWAAGALLTAVLLAITARKDRR